MRFVVAFEVTWFYENKQNKHSVPALAAEGVWISGSVLDEEGSEIYSSKRLKRLLRRNTAIASSAAATGTLSTGDVGLGIGCTGPGEGRPPSRLKSARDPVRPVSWSYSSPGNDPAVERAIGGGERFGT